MEILLELLTPEGLVALNDSRCCAELLDILTPEEIANFFNQIAEIDCNSSNNLEC